MSKYYCMNNRIKTRLETTEKHKSLSCKVFEVKVDKSRLSKHSKEHLKLLFLESKWLYNSILSSKDIKTYDTKIHEVSIKVQDHQEQRKLYFISSQMKQAIRDRTFQNILNLSKAKKKGIKIGSLKFKSYVNSVPLKQSEVTYKVLKSSSSIKLQGLKKPLKIRGLEQIPKEAEFANAVLVQKGGDYYFKLTTFIPKIKKEIPNKSIGIDIGCTTQLTLSNRIKLEFEIPIPKKLRKLDRKIMKNVNGEERKRSSNKLKDQARRRKIYSKIKNKKTDIRNKIVSVLTNNYKYVIFQDENIKAWKAGRHGKKIQNTGVGGIIRDLKEKSHTPILVDQFFPSTQLCSECGNKHKLQIWERTYVCPVCGFEEDRDVKSAQCIETEGLKTLISTERRNLMTGDAETSSLNIFRNLLNIVKVSLCEKPEFNTSLLNTVVHQSIKLGKSQEAPDFNRG